jgi:alpha-tubulin suppressor-like RCC1 family protein
MDALQGDEEWAFEPQQVHALSEAAREGGGLASVALGGLHSAALMRDGTLYTWGHGGFGALGACTTLTPISYNL